MKRIEWGGYFVGFITKSFVVLLGCTNVHPHFISIDIYVYVRMYLVCRPVVRIVNEET